MFSKSAFDLQPVFPLSQVGIICKSSKYGNSSAVHNDWYQPWESPPEGSGVYIFYFENEPLTLLLSSFSGSSASTSQYFYPDSGFLAYIQTSEMKYWEKL